MPTELLSIGPITAMLQNVVYALPASRVLLFSDGVAPAFQQSNTVDFTANIAVVLTAGMAELSGGFLRMTALSTCNVTLKKA